MMIEMADVVPFIFMPPPPNEGLNFMEKPF